MYQSESKSTSHVTEGHLIQGTCHMASAGKTKGPSERLRGRGFSAEGIQACQGSGESDL